MDFINFNFEKVGNIDGFVCVGAVFEEDLLPGLPSQWDLSQYSFFENNWNSKEFN